MRFRGTLWLLAAAVLAGAVYFLYVAPRAEEQRIVEDVNARFFRADSSQVEFLRIAGPGGTYTLTRIAGRWNIQTPRLLPADSRTVDALLNGLREGRISKIITQDAGRLAEFGLQSPPLVVSLGFAGRIDELAFGSTSPLGTGCYAYARGVQAVFLLDKDLPRVFNVSLHDLRSKEVFAFDPRSVTRMRISRKRGEIELVKGPQGWRMTRPIAAAASEDAIRTYLDGIAGQRAEEVLDDRIPKPGDYPRMTTLLLQEGSDSRPPVRVDIHYWGTGAREGVIAYQQGMPYAGRLVREFWDLVDRDTTFFRSKNLMRFREDEARQIRVVRNGAQYVLRKTGRTWTIDGKEVPEQRIVKLLWFLQSWTAAEILDTQLPRPNAAASYAVDVEDGSGALIGSVRIFDKAGDRRFGYSKEGPVDHYYGSSRAIEGLCVVSGLDLNNIPAREDLTK